jgi:hypothetical protein
VCPYGGEGGARERQTKAARRLVAADPGTTPAEVQRAARLLRSKWSPSEQRNPAPIRWSPSGSFSGATPIPRMMKRLVNAYGIARGVETLRGYNLQDDPKKEQESAMDSTHALAHARYPPHLVSRAR